MDKKTAREYVRTRVLPTIQVKTDLFLQRLVKLLETDTSCRTILLYMSIVSANEIDISSLPARLPDRMFDTVESSKDAPFPASQYDAVIVPLFGFNAKGFRLGRGGGWYDRFLATQPRALKIGVGYESALVDFIPEPHDIPMDVIVTEQRIRDFRVQ